MICQYVKFDMNSELTQIEQNNSVIVFSPSEIFGLYSDFLARQGGRVVGVCGIFNSGAGKSYGGFYYDTISDQYSGQELGIKIPSMLRDKLTDGNLVDLAGVIERKLNPKGFIQLTLAVTRADIVLEQTMSEDDMKRIEIRNRKAERGFKNVDLILESRLMADERPQVALVFAETSITDADFNAGKEAAEAMIDFEEFRINFAKPDSLIANLKALDEDEYDAIALIRGGGSGIEQLDNVDVLETVCNMDIPVICAIGHVEEKLFIKYIADKVAPTPNGLGAYFKDMVETVAQKRSHSKEALTKQIEAQFKQQIETAKKQNAELQTKLEQLSKNSEASQKLHKEQIDAANKQNAELQKKIEEINKGAEAGRKANEDQMAKLNAQLAELQKTNKSQGEMFGAQLKTMQESNGKLQSSIDTLSTKNNEYSEKLAKSEARCSQLATELSQEKRKKGGWGVAIAAVAIIIALIIALITK